MKYTDVPRGNCVLFKNGQLAYHSNGADQVLQNRPFWFFKPYVVEASIVGIGKNADV